MKMLFILALSIVSCATPEPIQVKSTALTLNRIETKYRYHDQVYLAIWKDRRGVEYQEEIEDTSHMLRGRTVEGLLRR
jgi:hypothetical protein